MSIITITDLLVVITVDSIYFFYSVQFISGCPVAWLDDDGRSTGSVHHHLSVKILHSILWLILQMYRLAVMESILAAHAGISASPIRHQNQESFEKRTHLYWQAYKQDLKTAENNDTFKVKKIYMQFLKNLFTEKTFFLTETKKCCADTHFCFMKICLLSKL